jgi:hypothetical protein
LFGTSSGTVEAVGGVSSGTGPALFGFSSNGIGAEAESTYKNGVFATSTNNDGINASTSNNSTLARRGRSGIYAHDDSTDGGHLNVGVAGASNNGIGVEGVSSNWVGVNAVGGGSAVPALSVVGVNNALYLIDACALQNPCDIYHSVFSVNSSGAVGAGSLSTISDIDSGGDMSTTNLLASGQIGAQGSMFDLGGFAVGKPLPAVPPSGYIDITGQYLKSGSCVAGCALAG